MENFFGGKVDDTEMVMKPAILLESIFGYSQSSYWNMLTMPVTGPRLRDLLAFGW
jgi:hypothetical protein